MVILIVILAVSLIMLFNHQIYKKSAYYQITKNSYSSVKNDKGKHTEYLTYQSLRHLEYDGGKFLFNIIIPKGYNKTTEIDVILICSKGLFVFECKNYSGWIFGHEEQKNWVQALPQGRYSCQKFRFYNPIMQNAMHIKYLKNILGQNVPMRSIIVFSDRCELKEITVKSDNVSVINHYSIASFINEIYEQISTDFYTEIEVNELYEKLYPYTQLDHESIEKHTDYVKKVS